MTFREVSFTTVLMMAALVATTGQAFAKDQPKTREVVAKVVAVDLQAKSIQADVGTGRSQTFPVVGEAAEHLDQLPVGRMFKLTFQHSDDPTRQVVIAIKRAKNTVKS
jgi:hypothetical protein